MHNKDLDNDQSAETNKNWTRYPASILFKSILTARQLPWRADNGPL